MAWSKEEARDLAQKGYDYEVKMAQIKAERGVDASEKDDFNKWKSWRETLRADPDRAEAVARAWQDPGIVLNPEPVVGDPEGSPQPRPPFCGRTAALPSDGRMWIYPISRR